MGSFMALAGVIWAFAGVAVLYVAKGAIHEILGAVLLSFAVLFFGVAGVLDRLQAPRQAGADHGS